MLRFSRKQIEHFAKVELELVIADLLDHLREALPEAWAEREASDARAAIDAIVERAIELGFDDEDELFRFAELATLVPALGDEVQHEDALVMLRSEAVVEHWPATRAAVVAVAAGDATEEDA